MLDDPVSSAPLPSIRSGSASHSISPVGCWWSSAKSIARSTTGNSSLEEPRVAGREVVVPHAVGDVAGDVGVERVFLHRVALVIRVPRSGEVLHPAQPLVGALGFGEPAADVERDRGLHEVPRVGLAAGNPRDVAVGLLHRRDRVDGLRDLGAGEDPGDLGELQLSQDCASPISRPSVAPSPRRPPGSCRAPG